MSRKSIDRRKQVAVPPEGKRSVLIVVISVLAVAMAAGLGLWWRSTKPSDVPPIQPRVEATAPTSPTTSAKPVAAQATVPLPKVDLQKLMGTWLRPDGRYLLSIKSVAEGGTLDASYVDPRPIHVAKAVASQVDNAVKVFIELRDVNDPGSTYDLTYDRQSDSLQGGLLPGGAATAV